LTRTLKVYGLGEAKVNEMIAPFFQPANPTLGIYAKPDGIHLRFIARGPEAAGLIENTERQIREILHNNIWGQDEETLPGIIGKLLGEKGLKLAIFDGGTRGIISNLLSQVEGSATYYSGGLITTNDEVKTTLGIPSGLLTKHGAVSAEVAEAMAAVVREKFRTDIGLSITGIGGLDDEKSTSGECYIGIVDGQGKVNYQQKLLPHRDNMRNLAAIAALFRLRQRLLEG
jgi:nicotinamide-nucleotide amidase